MCVLTRLLSKLKHSEEKEWLELFLSEIAWSRTKKSVIVWRIPLKSPTIIHTKFPATAIVFIVVSSERHVMSRCKFRDVGIYEPMPPPNSVFGTML